MNDREKSILGPLIDDHKSLGIPERDISKGAMTEFGG